MRTERHNQVFKSRAERPARSLFHLDGDLIPRDLRGCPFLCYPGVDYDRANDYFEEIHRRLWYPHQRRISVASAYVGRGLRRNRPASLDQRAYKLSNFVRWMAAENLHDGAQLSIAEIGEAHLDHFADDMESGEWSDDGEPLSLGYIAAQQIAVIDFLDWATHKNYRGPLDLICVSDRKSDPRNGRFATTFKVVRRPCPGLLEFPPPDTDSRVLKCIPDRADRLCGALIFRSGLRASEACEVGVDDIPLDNFETQAPVFPVLGKGRKLRRVALDRLLLPVIKDYRNSERARRLEKCLNAFGPDSAEYRLAKSRLFLNGRDGRALSYRSLYCAFKIGARLAGLPQLSPHGGRHFYAGAKLATAHRELREGSNLMDGLMPTIEFLRVQLGHSSVETTKIYLEAFNRQLQAAKYALPLQDGFLKMLQL